jgi:hypothetical protein
MTRAEPLSEADLNRFTGTEHWYRHGLNWNVTFSDGAKHVADVGGAYWLLDIIAIAQRYDKRVAGTPFQVWKLSVRPDHSATLRCEDGNHIIVSTQEIEYTDFPADECTLWFSDGVIYLPSEY